MNTPTKLLSLKRKIKGATMVEYAIMVALIAAVAIAIITALGITVTGVFTGINAQLGGIAG